MADVLYVLGSGSQYDNLELRLSLRSLEQNCKDLGRVFIVGYKPKWIQNVVYLDEQDNLEREKNVFKKVLRACESGISENFLFMNDDFYMMKPFNIESYPYFVNGFVRYVANPSRWQEIFNKTIVYLQEKTKKDDILDFCVHCPILYSTEKFLSLKSLYEKTIKDKCGYSPRLLYGNLFVKDTIKSVDCKLWDSNLIQDNLQGCISTKDDCEEVLKQLEMIYNTSSKYERKGEEKCTQE